MERFVPFDQPRKGTFLVETHKYVFPIGWTKKREEGIIIGETERTYVTEIKTVEFGMWEGDKVIQYKEQIHIGFHKSRFVCWEDHQLTLF